MRLTLFALAALLIAPSVASQSAEGIFREVDRRQRQVPSQRADIDMEIVDDRGRARSSSMILLTKIGDGDTFKALVVFTAPEDIRGTGLLTLHTASGDEQMFYVPALDRIQRVDGSLRGERLGGSDFTFEDISPRDPEDYTFHLIRTTETAWIIRATPKTAAVSEYGKIVLMVDRQRYAILRMDCYDRQNRRIKRLVASEFEEVRPGVWQASRLSMEDKASGRRTTLSFTNRSQASLSDALFTEQQLRLGVDGL
ncbi:MAG: outer membrane lipoprotein-sorting protein [Bacteroidetes bacterium]|nr:outer membrane lipoprotein-sorting protein [Bacteroidota bacterium]